MWSLCLAVAMMQSDDPFHGAKWLTVEYPKQALESAKWIWVQKPGEPAPTDKIAPAGTVTFRREFELPEGLRFGKISFAADNKCQVKINGRQYGQSDTWQQLTETHLQDQFRPGKNVIEITATNEGGPAGVLFALQASPFHPLIIGSDGQWTSPDGKVVELGTCDMAPWRISAGSGACPIIYGAGPKPEGKVKRATARVIGLGHYDLYFNGKRQGNAFANQPWSQYDKTIYWQEFDVTKDVNYTWYNQVELHMGNGFYRVDSPPSGRYTKGDAMPNFGQNAPFLARVMIELELENGKIQRIVSDENWGAKASDRYFSHIFAGEDYYPFGLQLDWYGQPPAITRPKLKVAESPKAELLKADFPLLKPAETWKPVEIKNPRPGVWSYVFPQNTSAFLRFKIKGPRQARVKFLPSEVMTPDGQVQQLNLHGGEASCTYVLRGWPFAEEYEWRFWYHGFQFVQVTGAVPAGQPNPDNLPVLESLEMVHVRADNKQIGEFKTSSDLYNRTHSLVDWAMRSNMSYVMTDCPQREKLGWQEQVHLLFPTFAYRYDCPAWFRKIARDIRDAQLPDGRFVTVAPDYLMLPPDNHYKFTVEWGASGVLMPWQAYQWYGDRRFLTENYDAMKRFVDYLMANLAPGLGPVGLGDWYDYGHGQPPGPSRYTPTDLTSTATWLMCLDATASAAEVLGKKNDAEQMRLHLGRLKTLFLEKYYDTDKKQFRNHGSVQTGHAMALCAGAVPDKDRPAVLQAIIDELEKRDFQQTAGDIGHLYFIRALAEAGRSDVLHKVYSRTGVGSYGGILAKGLTTMPETWDAITVGSNSLNHCMLGHVMEWFYGWILGIRQAPGSVGWQKILIAPEPGSLTSANGKTSTPNGPVTVEWKKTGHDFQITVEVPKGAKASVALPVKSRILKVDGKPAPAKQGVFGRATVEVGPGRHVVRVDG